MQLINLQKAYKKCRKLFQNVSALHTCHFPTLSISRHNESKESKKKKRVNSLTITLHRRTFVHEQPSHYTRIMPNSESTLNGTLHGLLFCLFLCPGALLICANLNCKTTFFLRCFLRGKNTCHREGVQKSRRHPRVMRMRNLHVIMRSFFS